MLSETERERERERERRFVFSRAYLSRVRAICARVSCPLYNFHLELISLAFSSLVFNTRHALGVKRIARVSIF